MNAITRRGLLGAISVAPAAAAALLSAPALASVRTGASAQGRWHRLKARLDRLEAEYTRFHNTVVIPADKAAADEIAALPHVSAECPGWAWIKGVRQNTTITTAASGDLRMAAQSLAHPEGHEPEYLAACRTITEGQRDRDAAIERINEHHQCDALSAHADRLDDIAYRLRWKLMVMPAPDAAAALWKLDYLVSDDGCGSMSAWSVKDPGVSAAIADVRRHLGGGA
ncbi:hypothetical protein LQ953_13385 [Sphingomonas sp. IC-56]|uniref:hypothetical protein n=1 Tax=Sphingomonas sp. IC-56 TaxID=2898529 RepID=UPI001E5A6766|nr:hypothetical protein [Sphingomonas sp. IC-56]MCD2325011.1 hypothetical protein [Sphingomonas sp. IC-56]